MNKSAHKIIYSRNCSDYKKVWQRRTLRNGGQPDTESPLLRGVSKRAALSRGTVQEV